VRSKRASNIGLVSLFIDQEPAEPEPWVSGTRVPPPFPSATCPGPRKD